MVISGSCKHRYDQFELRGRIPKVLTFCYREASSRLFFSINYKNDSTIVATALEIPNCLSTDYRIFTKNKGDYYQILPRKPNKDRY